jgi:hypothetical protein
MKEFKKIGIKPLQVFFCMLFLVISGCENREDIQPDPLGVSQTDAVKSGSTVYYGPESNLGNGTARVWVEMIKGKPAALGVDISESALMNMGDHYDISLKLPGQAHTTGFKTIMMGWNPMGHEPPGIYTLPHFDFHFYMITEGQIKQIKGGLDEGGFEIINKGIFPPYYVFGPAPMAVPQMGLHWVDVRSPEFSPVGFSNTFIYGSNKDRVTFLEPMITRSYLLNMSLGQVKVLEVPSLNIYEDPGYYPNTYTIRRNNNGSFSVALTDMVWRNKNR